LRWFSTQIATCLALVAAFSFVLDGALGADHPVAATGAHYHAHSHGPAGASHHQLVDGDVVDDVDGAAAHHDGSSPVSSPDTGASCCVCTCCAAHVPPCLSAQAAPFLLLYFSTELGLDHQTTLWLYALLLVGAVVGPILAGVISDRFGRKKTLVVYYLLSAVGIVGVIAAGGNVIFLAPMLLPFGTAVFSEGPVLQAFLADRAVGPIRDVAFAVYFTAAFGIGAVWALIIGNVAYSWGYSLAFGVMAVSYLAGAALISRVHEV
jgi:hypothetical protein